MSACPFCEGEVSATAQKCRHCGEWLSQRTAQTTAPVVETALNVEVARYIAAGYQVESRNADSVILRKAKRFNWVAFILFALLWILPAVIYLLVYATRGTPTVELRETAGEITALGAVLPPGERGTEPEAEEEGGFTLPVGLIAFVAIIGWFVFMRVQGN